MTTIPTFDGGMLEGLNGLQRMRVAARLRFRVAEISMLADSMDPGAAISLPKQSRKFSFSAGVWWQPELSRS